MEPAKAVASRVTCSHWACPTGRRLGVDLEHLDVSSDKLEEVEGGRSGLSHFRLAEEENKCLDDS